MLQGVGGQDDVEAGVAVGKSADVLVTCAVYKLPEPLGTPIVREGLRGSCCSRACIDPIDPIVLISAMSSSRNVGFSINWANEAHPGGPYSETRTSAMRLTRRLPQQDWQNILSHRV